MAERIKERKNRSESYQAVALNALKHGVLSRVVVLPHEDANEYSKLLADLNEEHQPVGLTERHLVEELASTIWRKRRALLAEGATINRNLAQSLSGSILYWPTSSTLKLIEKHLSEDVEPATKTQTLGESVQLEKLENLSRYETHLDRKFERTLAVLLKLRELRGG